MGKKFKGILKSICCCCFHFYAASTVITTEMINDYTSINENVSSNNRKSIDEERRSYAEENQLEVVDIDNEKK